MSEEALANVDTVADGPGVVGKIAPNIIVIDGGASHVNAKPVALSADEAEGMGDPEPDAETAAAAERLRRGRLGYCAIKRLFDIAFSLLIIVAFSWLFLLTAIAIKVDDPSGPVFFGQDRVGRDGKRFRMWKFRSMCADAEAKLAELQAKNEKDGPVFKMADDPRITRVGRVIRKTSIDELPQFFNVLIGQMSVVGPRPALPKEVATYTPRQEQRLLVKPGMTCYWQTRRNCDTILFRTVGRARSALHQEVLLLERFQARYPNDGRGADRAGELIVHMIITRTPFRMSFFGGGTDLPEFFNEHGGSVISTTFDKYCYVTARHLPRFFEYSTELVYSKIERVTDLDDMEHPAVRNAMRMLDMREMRVAYEADLPARSGLGTSSSFAVGMLNAFHCMKGTYASKERLAREAIKLERELCAEAGGWQDQVAAAFGGLNRIDFADGDFSVRPIVIAPGRKRELEANLLIFFTGFTRFSSDMQKANRVADKTAQLKEMLALVDVAEAALTDKDKPLSEFGRLLDTTWRLKRGTGNQVSTGSIDALYERGMGAGALGGKLLGAGGGGFLVFYVEPDAQASVKEAMSDLLYIPFKFEDGGTQVVYYGPEDYDLGGER